MNESLRSSGRVRPLGRPTQKSHRSTGPPHHRTGDHTVIAESWPATPAEVPTGATEAAGWAASGGVASAAAPPPLPGTRTAPPNASVIATMATDYARESGRPIRDSPLFSIRR